MKVFSIFTGIGGFDLAFRNLGHEIVGACEIDKYARDIYSKHFPNVKIHHDATKMSPKSLPPFDVLCAGFPCQAFSIAGKRAGFDDPRGNLFFEIARIAKEKRPRYLLLENVKGLLSHDNGETFRIIISTLDEMGYDAEWQVLNSKYFVPQNRERIFIIGHLRGERTRQVFPLGDYDKETTREIKHYVNSDSQAERVYDTEGIGPTLGIGNAMSKPLVGVVNDKKGLRDVDNATCLDANYWKGYDQHGARTMIKEIIAWSSSGRDGYREDRIKTGEANTLTTGEGCKGQSTDTFVKETVKDCREKDTETMIYLSNKNANMKERIQDREESWTLGTGTDFGIMDGDRKISNTVRTSGRGSTDRHSWDIVNDKTRIRRLTPMECERLQGFPDNWTEGISDTQRYKCCGNAVTVPVIEYIAKQFIEDIS